LNGPANLIPIINWHSSSSQYGAAGATQGAHTDSSGFWLDNMVRLRRSSRTDEKAAKELEQYVYGSEDPAHPNNIYIGIFRPKAGDLLNWEKDLLKFFVRIGFTGSHVPQICEKGLFYTQKDIQNREEVEFFAAASIVWKFGNPGLARWKEDGIVKYCAGIYAGLLKQEEAESILII